MPRLLVLALLFPAFALADAVYSISASSTFAIGEGTAVVGPLVLLPEATGAASSTASYSVDAGGSLPPAKTRSLTHSGFAGYPGPSLASSTVMTGHIITIDNSTGLAPLMVAFTFSYSWSVDLSVTDPFSEFASGGAFFHITGIDTETLTISGFSVPEFRLHPTYTTLLGGTGGFGSGMVPGSIIVPAGGVATFSVITDSNGVAFTTPEPSTFGVATLGLAIILGLGRIRRCRPGRR